VASPRALASWAIVVQFSAARVSYRASDNEYNAGMPRSFLDIVVALVVGCPEVLWHALPREVKVARVEEERSRDVLHAAGKIKPLP